MRELRFKVNGQQLCRHPDCDFSGLVAGSSGYLKAKFDFDREWDGKVKVAEFRKNITGEPVPVAVVKDECIIPKEVLTAGLWTVCVHGKRGDYRITTNKCRVEQEA